MFKKFALVILGWAMLSSGTAHALSVEDVYGYCEPFAKKGFQVKEMTDGICLGYMRGFQSSRLLSCSFLKDQLKRGSISRDSEIWRSRNFVASDANNIRRVILSFLNWAEDNPSKWSELFVSQSFYWMMNDYPCEAD